MPGILYFKPTVLFPSANIQVTPDGTIGIGKTIVRLDIGTLLPQNPNASSPQIQVYDKRYYIYHPLVNNRGDEAVRLASNSASLKSSGAEVVALASTNDVRGQLATVIDSFDPALTGYSATLVELLKQMPSWNPAAAASAPGAGSQSRFYARPAQAARPAAAQDVPIETRINEFARFYSDLVSTATSPYLLSDLIKETFLVMAIKEFGGDTILKDHAQYIRSPQMILRWYHLMVLAHFVLKRPLLLIHADTESGRLTTPSELLAGAIEGDANVTLIGIEQRAGGSASVSGSASAPPSPFVGARSPNRAQYQYQHAVLQDDAIVLVCRGPTHFEALTRIGLTNEADVELLSVSRLNRLPPSPVEYRARAAERDAGNLEDGVARNEKYSIKQLLNARAGRFEEPTGEEENKYDSVVQRTKKAYIDAKIMELMQPESREMSQEFDVPYPLLEFVNLMRTSGQWRNYSRQDVELNIKSAVNMLQEYTYKSYNLVDFNMVVNIIGDQSSGKTTITNALTKQASFFVSATTGTRARTMIKTARDPRIQSGQTKCYLYYAGKPYGLYAMSESELSNVYMYLTDTIRRENTFSMQDFDITITHGRNDLGITVMDHPGINYEADATRVLTEDTIKRNFGNRGTGVGAGRGPNSSASKGLLLLVVNGRYLPADMQTVTFHRFLNMEEVYGNKLMGRFFVAVTMMDAVADPYRGLAVLYPYADAVRQYVNPEANRTDDGVSIDYQNRRVKATPKQIYEGMKSKLTSACDTKGRKTLPDHSKVFFVALCDRDTNILRQYVQEMTSMGEAIDTFQLFQRYYHENNYKMIQGLTNADRWAQFGIDVDFNGSDPDDLESWRDLLSFVGVERLFEHLWERQFSASLGLVNHIRQGLGKKIQVMDSLVQEIESRLKTDYHYYGILTEFVRTYHDLFDLLSHGEKPQPAPALIPFLSRLETLIKQGDLGWSIEDEYLGAEALFQQPLPFPHGATKLPFLLNSEEESEDSIEDAIITLGSTIDNKMREYVPGMELKHNNLKSLLKRLQDEYLYRLHATPVPEVDTQTAKKFIELAPPGDIGGTKILDRPISDHVREVFRTLFYSNWEQDTQEADAPARHFLGANLYLAQRVAVAHMLQAHSILSILPSLTQFKALFMMSQDSEASQTQQYQLPKSKRIFDEDESSLRFGINLMADLAGIDTIRKFSMELNDKLREKCESLVHAKKSTSADGVALKSFKDFVAQAGSTLEVLPEETSTPKDDIVAAVVAHYYDSVFRYVRQELDHITRRIERLRADSFLTMSVELAPTFLYHDPSFVETYKTKSSTPFYTSSDLAVLTFKDEIEHLRWELHRFGTAYTNAISAMKRTEQNGNEQLRQLHQYIVSLTYNVYQLEIRLREKEEEDALLAIAHKQNKRSKSTVVGGHAAAPSSPGGSSSGSNLSLVDIQGVVGPSPYINPTRLEYLQLAPYKYPDLDEEGRFRLLRKNTHVINKFMRPLHSIHNMEIPDEFARSDMAISMTDIDVGENMPPIASAVEPKAHDLEAINYIYKRQFTAMTYRAMNDVVGTLQSLQIRFDSSVEKQADLETLFSRICSLFLGYPYAYALEERPEHLSYLDPDNIIPFLRRNLGVFLGGSSEYYQDADQLVVLPHELNYIKSPLVRYTIRLAKHKPLDAVALVINLYNNAYPRSKLRGNTQDHKVMEELSKSRYASDYHVKLYVLYETLKHHSHNWKRISDEFVTFIRLVQEMGFATMPSA